VPCGPWKKLKIGWLQVGRAMVQRSTTSGRGTIVRTAAATRPFRSRQPRRGFIGCQADERGRARENRMLKPIAVNPERSPNREPTPFHNATVRLSSGGKMSVT
jgi:hypothetical protein